MHICFTMHICFANTLCLALCLHYRGRITDRADNCGMHAMGFAITGENLNYSFPN